MNYFTSMTIKSQRIIWVRWPGCEGHQKPCKGCPDYCDINATNADELGAADLQESYGDFKCRGETWYDETTAWVVTAELKSEDGPAVELNGMGQSIGECLAEIWQLAVDYEAAMAAAKIQRSEYE